MKHYRYIPKNSTAIEHPEGLGVVYTYESERGAPLAIAYAGKAAKASWHHSFLGRDPQALRDERIREFFEGLSAHKRMVDERKRKRQEPHALKVGDIVYNSWGWEQTNVDFYAVTKTTAHYVWLRALNQTSEETGFMCGNCAPIPGDYASEAIVQHRAEGTYVSFKHGSGSKWDGEPKRYSCYA